MSSCSSLKTWMSSNFVVKAFRTKLNWWASAMSSKCSTISFLRAFKWSKITSFRFGHNNGWSLQRSDNSWNIPNSLLLIFPCQRESFRVNKASIACLHVITLTPSILATSSSRYWNVQKLRPGIGLCQRILKIVCLKDSTLPYYRYLLERASR